MRATPRKEELYDGHVVRVLPDHWLPKSSQRFVKKAYKENSTMAKKEKVEFSKFFPQSTSFVVVSGSAEGSDDFGISVEIGDGSDKVSFYLSDWLGQKDGLASLKAVQEGIQKAIDFYGKALNLPKAEADLYNIVKGAKQTAKKAATRKTAAKK